jgi:hypothetical protein
MNLKVHYRIERGPTFGPYLESVGSSFVSTPCVSNINFNIILPYIYRSPKYSLFLMISDQIFFMKVHQKRVSS